MKKTRLRRFLPILLTLLTVVVCTIGITATATEEETRSNQITHANLVLDNDVDLVFWADITEDAAKKENTVMMFNDTKTVSYFDTRTLDGVTYALFKYDNILPQDLGDVINAKLYVNGVLTSYVDYSVKNYCQYVLTNTNNKELKTLVSDLLVYGAESQNFNGESADNAVTNGMVGLAPSATPDKMTVLFGQETSDDLSRGATASLSNSKLLMDNGIELHFNVDLPKGADPSEYTVCLSVNGREQEVPIISKVTVNGYTNRVSFKGIYSYELFDIIQVNVYKNNVRVSNSTSFSVASYVDALNKNPEYTAVTNAYYNYCYSSHIYAGAHTVVMPGEIQAEGKATDRYDDVGTISYKCSLCGYLIENIEATHIRTFENGFVNGSPANTVKTQVTDENGNVNTITNTLFTLDTPTETLEDGTTNKFLSITRDLNTNKGSGGFGYYVAYENARPSAIAEYIDNVRQYTGTQFTLSFDIKSPEAGLAPTGFYIRNATASSSEGRFGEILTINSNGSMTRSSTKIADAGTITADSWSTVTITIDMYKDGDVSYIYLEYYINDVLQNAFSIANPMKNARFTDIHVSIGTDGLSNGQGVLLDNIVFAQGCVHSFTGDVKDQISKLDGGNLRKIIDMVQNDFDIEDFSYVVRWDGKSSYTYTERQDFVSMSRDKYEDPLDTPKSYDHPRLLFNSSDIPSIVENINNPANAGARSAFMDLVNASTDGKLPSTDTIAPQAFEHTNYDTKTLRSIEAKAFYYAIYKDSAEVSSNEARLRGYEAIYAMKNYLLTFDVQWKASDQCRYYGDVMYYAALVYDWCYDLLTDDDKAQFMVGVQNLCCDGTNNEPWKKNSQGVSLNTHDARKLEGGFPAFGKEEQSRLTGHGAEAQVLRDYFAFSVAIFDEDSSWYDYVGGLVYQDYIDARDYFYASHFYPDGSAVYNYYRFLCDLNNAWIFKSMGADIPYNEEDMATVVHGMIAMETENGFQFATGDGTGTGWYNGVIDQSRLGGTLGDCALVSSYLFDDDVALAIAHRFRGYTTNYSTAQMGISAANYLILTSNGLTQAEDYQAKVKNVEYHGSFQQQVIARNTKDDGGAVVLMQGAQHLPGGHTHQNAGNFQIWYKGMLTRDDGLYDAYGSDHHHYYHMAATAHNTLLIFNPDLKDMGTEPVGRTGYYNGGQRSYLGLPTTFTPWIKNENFSYGSLIGMQYDDAENPSYVYFGNDITNAYDAATVDYVERSFMTLYTGDAETPMVMFVFDNITSDRPEFQKTFLLQCATAPEIDYDNSTVTVDNGEGKLVLTSLLGNDAIKAYGRTSKDGVVMPESYFIDESGRYTKEYMAERFYLSGQGKNLAPGGAGMIGDSSSDLSLLWGHVEIQPTANSYENQLMNVLYVSDSGTTVSATPRLIEGNNITGATFKSYTSVFANNNNRDSEMSFVSTADDGITSMTYYIGGLAEGEWKVFVNDKRIYAKDAEGNDTDFEVTEDGKMITFEGAVGEVRIEPGESMRPHGSMKISYNLNGGKWEGDAPLGYYNPGQKVTLPTPVRNGSTFSGWFTDREYTNPITEIPETATESYTLYAKWTTPILHVDYTLGGSVGEYSQVNYSGESSGSTWDIINTSEPYLLWTTTAPGGIIGKNGGYASYAEQSYQVSFVLSFARDGSNPLIPLQLYTRDDSHGRFYSNIFMTDIAGNAYVGSGGHKYKIGEIASSGISSFRFTLDFENGTLTAVDEHGEVIVTNGMSTYGISLPSGCASYKEWFSTMMNTSSSLMSLKGGGAGSIRVYELSIISGSFNSCKNFGPTSNLHVWDEGTIVTHPSTTDCTPGVMVRTCSGCEMTLEISIPSEVPHQNVTHSVDDSGKITYSCETCGYYFSPAANFYLDGSSYDGIVGVGNTEHFTTKDETNQPVINSGAYELINKTGENGNLELWVPGRTPSLGGFSSENNAIGFVAFKVNALTTDKFDFNFVDTSSSGEKWSSEWCLTDSFLRIFAPTEIDGKTVVRITGWDSLELAQIEVPSAKNFTEWIDVKIFIHFDSAADQIILDYYISDQYVGSASRKLTTSTNAINSFCITGSTSEKGSGIKIDDISFGYTANGYWGR